MALVARDDSGKLFVTVPAFTKVQYEEFIQLAENAFNPSINLYSNTVASYVDGYKKLFPTHLEDDITRTCNYMFLTIYATTVCNMAKEKDLLTSPPSTVYIGSCKWK